MEKTEILLSLTDAELEHLQGSIRSDIQNFYDDPTGYLSFGHGEGPEFRKAATELEVKKLNTLCEKLGLVVQEVMDEEGVTEYEVNRVVNLMKKGEEE